MVNDSYLIFGKKFDAFTFNIKYCPVKYNAFSFELKVKPSLIYILIGMFNSVVATNCHSQLFASEYNTCGFPLLEMMPTFTTIKKIVKIVRKNPNAINELQYRRVKRQDQVTKSNEIVFL